MVKEDIFFSLVLKKMKEFVFLILHIAIVTEGAVLNDMTTQTVIHDNLKHIHSKTSDVDQAEAVNQLIRRIVPNQASKFLVVVSREAFDNENDVFEFVSVANGSLKITASSGFMAATGFYHYLKYWCFLQISWSGDNLNMTDVLPVVQVPYRKVFLDRFRYYQNVCTVSYSMAFWSWERWEREIDWMAMNAINLPLAFTGQESIWRIVYKKLGLTQDELDQHFGGPGFLAWQRMGNLDGWGGPLPPSWYDKQLELQLKILSRMRSLGITPVLPGFGGHVPKALVTRVFPDAKYYQLKPWGGFDGQYGGTFLLDPQDPLFEKVGTAFILAQSSLYNGTDHVYNADIFNEMDPPILTADYIRNVSSGVYRAMVAADSKAVWLMQAWMFLNPVWKPELIKTWLSAIELGRLILLDLASELYPIYEQTDAYYGHPFIWCMIENFGGITRLYGKVSDVVKGVLTSREKHFPFMIGTGMTAEGINQNDINFELLNEMAWRKTTFNLTEWTMMYIKRRYAVVHPAVNDAWTILIGSVYDCHDNNANIGFEGRIPVMRPVVNSNLSFHIWYEPSDLVEAWSLMVNATGVMKHQDTFRNDLVRLGTQVLEDVSLSIYDQLVGAFLKKDLDSLQQHGIQLNGLLADMDRLLATDPYSLLGTWIESAKSLGDDVGEKSLLEFNAKNQITLWGPSGNVHDYANKNWADLVKDYYGFRWNALFLQLADSLKTGVEFNYTNYLQTIMEYEQSWNRKSSSYPTTVTGDAYDVSKELFMKYSPLVNSLSFKRKQSTLMKRANRGVESPIQKMFRVKGIHLEGRKGI